MSIKRMNAVWEHSQHKGSALLLMLAIADVADDLGVAWPGYHYLAHKIRMERGSAIRLADFCHESGELWKVSRAHQRSNMYVVTVGLSREELRAAAEKLVAYGVMPTMGSRILQPPPQVLGVVSRSYYLAGNTPGVVSPIVPGSTIAIVPGSTIAIVPDPSLSVITPQEDGSFWDSVLTVLRGQMTKATFEAHFLGSTASRNNGTLTVALRSPGSVEWLDNRMRPLIGRAVNHVTGQELELAFAAQGALL